MCLSCASCRFRAWRPGNDDCWPFGSARPAGSAGPYAAAKKNRRASQLAWPVLQRHMRTAASAPPRGGPMANGKLIALALAALAEVLAGCNTMHGLGQDIERGGEKIQSAADKAKK